jgi:predicted RNA-binding Zn ribbon-like protein
MTMPSWVPDQETKPAPMPLLLVQSFVNTWDGDHASDLLLDPAAARDWLSGAGLWSADRPPEPAELDLARRVREGIRAMLVANGGGPPPAPGDLQAIRAVAQDSRPALQVGPGGQVSLGAEPSGRARSRAARPAAGHPRRATGRHLAAAEGLRQPRLPVGLLRPVP